MCWIDITLGYAECFNDHSILFLKRAIQNCVLIMDYICGSFFHLEGLSRTLGDRALPTPIIMWFVSFF